MPDREQTPGDAICPIGFLGLTCRFCHAHLPHPGDVAKQPEPAPGSVWAIVMEGLND